ncbi:MAG: oligogalacturonate lyase family protein [Planctomycetota bacterium]|jgi:oligogalacturonide lyase
MVEIPTSGSKVSSTVAMARRSFLGRVARFSGATMTAGAALGGTRLLGRQSGAEPAAAPPIHASAKTDGRGSTRRVGGEIQEHQDEETGARVRRLTADGSDNVHIYFTSESFVGGGSDNVVFASNRSGRFQFHLLEIPAGRLTQITDGDDVSPNMACVDPAGRLFYFDGPVLRSVSLDRLEDRELYRVPEGNRPALPTCTADGKHVAFAYSEARPVSTETGRIYSTMAERFYQRPSCVVMRIDTESGEAVAAWGERAWISHVLIHPRRPEAIVFCHEGGSYVAQRMWTVDLSSRRGRMAKPLYPQRPGEFCVHEYFTRQGDVGFQYEVDREGQMEYYNGFIRVDGTWIRQFLLPGRRPGHVQSNSDNTLLVGDSGYLGPDDRDGRNYMSLMTHANGRAHVRRLCRRVPGKTQHSHGHPVFSLDDQWVLYNSKIGETHNVYMADVTSID